MRVPKLRFKEFSGGWQVNTIGCIASSVSAGATPSTTKREYWGGDIRWMNSGELNLKRVYEVANRITEAGLKNSSTKILPVESVLIGLAGQGKTRGTVAINYVPLCTNQSIAAIQPNPRYFIPEFLYQNLDNRYLELRSMSTGDGGRGGLNLQIIKSVPISLPGIPEQKKIATFLSSIDQKIALLTKNHELLNQYKKGVMQKIFNQEIRFKDKNGNNFPDSKRVFLGDIAQFYKGKGISKSDISSDGLTPCIRYGELYTQYGVTISEVISKTNTPIKDLILSKANDVIIPASGETQIDIATASCVIHGGIALGGDLNIIRTEQSGVFLCYYLNSEKKLDIAKLAQGNSVVHLYASQLKGLEIDLPTLAEQELIANFLSLIDKKIALCNAELIATKKYKQGLLQQMFI